MDEPELDKTELDKAELDETELDESELDAEPDWNRECYTKPSNAVPVQPTAVQCQYNALED